MEENANILNQTNIAERDYKSLFLQSPAPIAIFSGHNLVCTFVNDAYAKIFNCSGILGKTLEQAFLEEELQPFFENLQSVYETGIAFYGNEIPLLTDLENNGIPVQRYYDVAYTAYYNNEGEIDGVMATANDVTRLVQAKLEPADELQRVIPDHQAYDIFMQAPVGICIFKGAGLVIEMANDSMLKLLGKHNEIIGQPALEALPEIEGQGLIEILEHVRQSGEPYYAHENAVCLVRNGLEEIVYADFACQPYCESGGERNGVLLFATEATDKVKTRKRIEESELKFRNVIEQAAAPILIFKGENMVLEVANQALLNLWNVGRDAVGKPLLKILPEMKDQVFHSVLVDVYENGTSHYGYEEPVIFYDEGGGKKLIYCNFVYQPYKEANGTISGVIVLATDVTDQVLARQKLELSEIRTRLAVEAARLGTYELNLLNEDFMYTPRQAEIFGLDPSVQWPFKVFKDSVHPEDVHLRLEAHERAKKTGEVFYEVRIIKPGGDIRWIRLNGNYKFENDIPVASFGTTMDITEEKKAAELLEQKIQERTRELQKANESLGHSNQQLEQFAHVASHDMKEPIRKVMVYANLIQEDGGSVLSERAKGHLTKVQSAADRLTKMVEGVLNLSSVSAAEGGKETIDLKEIINSIEVDLELLIRQKDAVINYDILPFFEGVPFLIYQLFYNLINNSLKFSGVGRKPSIDISFQKITGTERKYFLKDDKEYVEIVVKDNGIGFPQEYAESIFKTFTRLHGRNDYEGTGLGLALCKNIVARHQGFISAFSEIGKGASFVVVLPEKQ